MMSGEIVYSDVTFTRHQNQDAGAESGVSKVDQPGTSDPSPSVGSKAAIPEGGSRSVPVVTLVCVCVLLLGLAITLGVLYASNMTSLHAEEARFNQIKENLTVQKELLSSGLQDCKANLTRVKDLLPTIQARFQPGPFSAGTGAPDPSARQDHPRPFRRQDSRGPFPPDGKSARAFPRDRSPTLFPKKDHPGAFPQRKDNQRLPPARTPAKPPAGKPPEPPHPGDPQTIHTHPPLKAPPPL
ncbi:unnamed protein product [Coregonus sp. 'balchen']|nr:unnamed protein product [Coregonus sp. 'balchen']